MIVTQDLSVIYDNEVHALDKINLNLETGKMIAIVGPNGAGKSTLMKAMLKMIPHQGKTTFNGKLTREVNHKIAYVEQKSNIDQDFPISVLETTLLGTYRELGLFKRPGKEERERAMDALKQVGMEDFAQRQLGSLSGGQFQRILIARTIVQDADYIFLDEPFVGIDATSEAIIIRILKELVQEGKTILIVHHDLNKVEEYFDDIVLINHHLIAAGPIETTFTHDNLAKTFGREIQFDIGGDVE